MTAEPRPHLRFVPRDGAEADIAHWHPEFQFVGALLWHAAPQVAPLLALVPSTAIDDFLTRWVYELIAGLVADGRDPGPEAVLHRAWNRPATQALRPNRAPSQRDHRRLGVHLASLYTGVLHPAAAADHAHDVLEGAYRRAVRAAGDRLHHLADTCPDVDALTADVAATCAALTEPPRTGAA